MKYTEFMKGIYPAQSASQEEIAEYTEQINGLQSEVAALTERLETAENATPEIVQTTLRNEIEVNEVVDMLVDLRNKYFQDVPLTSIPGPMLRNIPSSLLRAIRFIHDHPQYPIIFNPVVALYLCCVEHPEVVIGRYLEIVGKLMDDNAQAIHEDAKEYMDDLNGVSKDEDDEDDDEEPAEQASDIDAEAFEEAVAEMEREFDEADDEDNRDVPDDDYEPEDPADEEEDYPEVDPDSVDVIEFMEGTEHGE